jgi:hypothetical protein
MPTFAQFKDKFVIMSNNIYGGKRIIEQNVPGVGGDRRANGTIG